MRQGADEHDRLMETQVPAPYLPAMLLYSNTLSAAALEEHGPLYNSNVETSVTSGPMKLVEWLVDQRVVYEKNPDYTGTLVVPITRAVVKLADPATFFVMYQNDEIDYMQYPAPADLGGAAEFPSRLLSSRLPHHTLFRCSKEPFDKPSCARPSHARPGRDQASSLCPPHPRLLLSGASPSANGETLRPVELRFRRRMSSCGRRLLRSGTFPAQCTMCASGLH